MADADRSPDDDDELIQDEREAEGEEKLVIVAGGVKPANAGILDDQPEHRDAERGKQRPIQKLPTALATVTRK